MQENEITKFDNLAHAWWDEDGELKTLHHLNPCRLAYIKQHSHLINKRVLDVGCGGGILSEALAKEGAMVTGIDLSAPAIEIAKKHAEAAGLNIDYFHKDASTLANEKPQYFDVIVCMELLEHLDNPHDFVQTLSLMLKPDGKIFFSTLNRTPAAYCFGIIAAEYLLKLLPQGTHDYAHFIKPAELASFARDAHLTLVDISGMSYNPWQKKASLTPSLSVNYLACFAKDVL